MVGRTSSFCSGDPDVRPRTLSREALPADPAGMLIGAVLLLVLLSVPVLRGDLTKLADLRFRAPWLVPAALASQVLIINVVPDGPAQFHRVVHLASYALLAGFLGCNLRQVPHLWIIAVGGACNLVAIAANGGVMPARPEALAAAGIVQAPGEFINSTAVSDPVLWWLGDVFAIPSWVPLANVFSVGDVVLVVGVALCVHATCRTSPRAALAPA